MHTHTHMARERVVHMVFAVSPGAQQTQSVKIHAKWLRAAVRALTAIWTVTHCVLCLPVCVRNRKSDGGGADAKSQLHFALEANVAVDAAAVNASAQASLVAVQVRSTGSFFFFSYFLFYFFLLAIENFSRICRTVGATAATTKGRGWKQFKCGRTSKAKTKTNAKQNTSNV